MLARSSTEEPELLRSFIVRQSARVRIWCTLISQAVAAQPCPWRESLGVPLLVTFHGADVTVRASKKNYYERLGEQATRFICVSEFIRGKALESGFPAEKLLVHYIGIDRVLFSAAASLEPPQGVLFVGRLVEKKGV